MISHLNKAPWIAREGFDLPWPRDPMIVINRSCRVEVSDDARETSLVEVIRGCKQVNQFVQFLW